MKLGIIIGATREGRQTPKQAQWVYNNASQMEGVDAELVDLIDYPMPIFDEAISPRYNPNRTPAPEVQKWLDKMASFEAYIFVTPEYNHSIPGVLKNAFDFMTFEMVHKPASIVSHGTVGGARAAMHLKEIISEGQALVGPKSVAFINMSQHIDDAGNIDEETKQNPYGPQTALEGMLADLQWTSDALSVARAA